ncbi:MAG: nucleoside-triphosphatase [Thermodesulfobacteriota bacterium]
METAKNILVTGTPGCGKSTLIERIIGRLDRPLTGFFTREIKEKGRRTGFAIITLDGQRGVLAHLGHSSRFRVGRYGVNLEDLERIAVPSLRPREPGQVVVVDEIGKMECFSDLFQKTLLETLASPHRVLGSIALRGGRFIQEIKARPDVRLVLVTKDNRDRLITLAGEL